MADNIAQVHTDLIDRLLANIPSGYELSRIKLPNAPFTTPKNKKWLRATIINGARNNVQATGNWRRTTGVMVVSVFVPVETGYKAQLADIQALTSTFENKEFGVANVKTTEAEAQAVDEPGPWYTMNLNINFEYEGA